MKKKLKSNVNQTSIFNIIVCRELKIKAYKVQRF